jgi:hypothetical protein
VLVVLKNTQIRGETIAKVFRKVDAFWTYQFALGSSLPHFEHKNLKGIFWNFSRNLFLRIF